MTLVVAIVPTSAHVSSNVSLTRGLLPWSPLLLTCHQMFHTPVDSCHYPTSAHMSSYVSPTRGLLLFPPLLLTCHQMFPPLEDFCHCLHFCTHVIKCFPLPWTPAVASTSAHMSSNVSPTRGLLPLPPLLLTCHQMFPPPVDSCHMNNTKFLDLFYL